MYSMATVVNSVCELSVLSHSFEAPWTVAYQAPLSSSLSLVFFRQGYCRGLPCPPPGDLPHPGIE